MDAIIRGATIYAMVWMIFRLTGRRTFAQLTSFDFVLLLIISESVQQGLLGDDFSLTNAILIVITMLSIDLLLSIVKEHSERAERVIDGLPVLLVDRGRLLSERLERERVDEQDILNAARERHGLEQLSQVKYAILERNGTISIIPAARDQPGSS
jgi:uncharacterized membrane protein YcaP (DUF421 family)